MRDDDAFAGEPFWDAMGPHEGPNLYARGTGECVPGWAVVVIQFRTPRSERCIARGVMLMDDDSVYTWSVMRERFSDMNGRRRLASRSRQSFRETAAGLLKHEQEYMDPDLYAHYAKKIEKINF